VACRRRENAAGFDSGGVFFRILPQAALVTVAGLVEANRLHNWPMSVRLPAGMAAKLCRAAAVLPERICATPLNIAASPAAGPFIASV